MKQEKEIMRGERQWEGVGSNELWVLIGLSNCWNQNPKWHEQKQEMYGD